MADKTMYPLNLYDANGAQTGSVEHEADLTAATAREGVLESGGKYYRWDQRNNQWREAEVTKLGKAEAYKPEGAPEQGGEKPVVTAPKNS